MFYNKVSLYNKVYACDDHCDDSLAMFFSCLPIFVTEGFGGFGRFEPYSSQPMKKVRKICMNNPLSRVNSISFRFFQ